jgi:spore coat protein U domain-containing protein, fimbrial subunit CupE1/2/3/6
MSFWRRMVFLVVGGVGVSTVCGDAWGISCSVAATGVNFGIYNPLSGVPNQATGTVTVTCDVLVGLLTSWTVSLGTGNGGTFSPRLLGSGGSHLTYNLYTSAAYSSVWGDGSGTTTLVSDQRTLIVGSNISSYTVYGRIPAGQDPAAGTYLDTIVVTVNY